MQHLKRPAIDLDAVVSGIRRCLPPGRHEYPLHEPTLAGNEWKYVKDCLDTGWVSSAGAYVGKFEQRLAELTGVRHVSAIVNGTAALHLALRLSGVEPGDEVLVPDFTFVATANAVAYCGGVPHLVDSEEKTLGVDPAKLEAWLRKTTDRTEGGLRNRQTGRRIRALIAMHTFGHPVDLEPLGRMCDDAGIELIEDAAESLGSLYRGRHAGHWGRWAILSFNGNKICTTGGGGAVLTRDERLGRMAKHLSTTAKLPHPWSFDHDHTGYNYRMPNLNAALGLAQLEELPGLLEKKRRLAARYEEAFREVPGVRFFREPEFARSNYWLNTLILDEPAAAQRDALLERLHAEKIYARPAWTLMHQLPMYAACPRMDVSTAESLQRRIVNVPSSASLA